VLIGDALVNENDRLQTRINQLLDRIEATLRQCLRVAATQTNASPERDTNAEANLMLTFVIGRWHQFAKSGFKRLPLDQFDAQKVLLFKFA
jgi:TetR/AcrR family transcriptional regulator